MRVSYIPKFGIFIGGTSARSLTNLIKATCTDIYVACSDDGTSTGRLERYCQEVYGMNIIPPGDVREVVSATSPYLCDIDPKRNAWVYRFKSDKEGPLSYGEIMDILKSETDGNVEIPEVLECFGDLKVNLGNIRGDTVGNLFLTAAMLNDGNVGAIRNVALKLDCRGNIIPVSNEYRTLFYADTNETTYEGEWTLDNIQRASYPVRRLRTKAPFKYNHKFLESLERVDVILFGPTSQVGNIWACFPENAENLEEVRQLIKRKPRLYSSPIMTEKNQTAFDESQLMGNGHLAQLRKILGTKKPKVVDAVIRPGDYNLDYNGIRQAYEEEGSMPVCWNPRDLENLGIVDICQEGLVDVEEIVENGRAKRVLRHNPEAHEEGIMKGYEQICGR